MMSYMEKNRICVYVDLIMLVVRCEEAWNKTTRIKPGSITEYIYMLQVKDTNPSFHFFFFTFLYFWGESISNHIFFIIEKVGKKDKSCTLNSHIRKGEKRLLAYVKEALSNL